ncbi:MAG: hypothetical protein PVG07_15995, partial [Acidobacteriota bacterium]
MPTLNRSLAAFAASACLLSFLLPGCAGNGAEPEIGPPRSAEEADADRSPDGPPAMDAPAPDAFDLSAALDRNLERVLARGGEWRELRIEAECLQDGVFQRVLIFGSGVAVWNDRRQIHLERDDLLSILEAIHEAGLSSMLELYGRGQEEPAPAEPKEGDGAIRITCRVLLTLDGVTKQAAQRARGPQ